MDKPLFPFMDERGWWWIQDFADVVAGRTIYSVGKATPTLVGDPYQTREECEQAIKELNRKD